MQTPHVNCIILYILHQNSAEHRNSAQFLLINHKLFKNYTKRIKRDFM